MKLRFPRNEDGTMRRKAKVRRKTTKYFLEIIITIATITYTKRKVGSNLQVEYPTTLPIFRPWLDEKNLWHEDPSGAGMIPMANMVPLWTHETNIIMRTQADCEDDANDQHGYPLTIQQKDSGFCACRQRWPGGSLVLRPQNNEVCSSPCEKSRQSLRGVQ